MDQSAQQPDRGDEDACRPTRSAQSVIGGAYDDNGNAIRSGGRAIRGNVRDVYLFASAFRTKGIRTAQGFVQIDQASFTDLQGAGLVGCWKAAYDPNGVVPNPIDDNGFAASSNGTQPLVAAHRTRNRRHRAVRQWQPGAARPVTSPRRRREPIQGATPSRSTPATYRIQEISFWSMARQAYQVISDMFGQLIPSNEPFLSIYLPGSFSVDASASTCRYCRSRNTSRT